MRKSDLIFLAFHNELKSLIYETRNHLFSLAGAMAAAVELPI
jgi:hypothetical protein